MNTPAKTRHAASLLRLAAAASLVGCYGGPDDAATTPPQNLNGEVLFPADAQCSVAEQDKVSQALGQLRTFVVTSPTALRACLRNGVLLRGDDFAEEILARLAQDLPTTVRCRELGTTPGGATINADAPLDITNEQMRIDHGLLTQSVARVAAVMLHELAHNKGYTHVDGTEYEYSVNEQVENCVSGLVSSNGASGSPSRMSIADMRGEVELQRVGGTGGTVFEEFCPGSSFVTGVQATASTGASPAISGFWIQCRANGGSASTRVVYGVGATARSCASDEVIVGFQGHADAGATGDVNRLAPICAKWTNVQAGVTTASTLPSLGSSVGRSFERRCPPGTALKGVLGRGGAFAQMNELRLVCRALSGVSVGDPNDLVRFGNEVVGGSNRVRVRQLCSDTGALVGLYGRADSAMNRLGGICAGLRTSSFLNIVHPYATPGTDVDEEHVLSPVGGSGGDAFAGRCPSGQVMVGFRAGLGFWGDAVSHVAGVCAPSHLWMRTASSVTTTTIGAFGNDRGNGVTALCPRGEVLTGLDAIEVTRVDAARVVESVRPICRRIDVAPAD